MKTGILGGSFNPIHNGHLQMARLAMEKFGLDRVFMTVASDPPHKKLADNVTAEIRYSMVCAVLTEAGDSRISANDTEIRRGGKSYTSDTLKELHKEYPCDELYLILGADMVCDFPNWHCPDEIAKSARIIAIKRPEQQSNATYAESVRLMRENFGAEVYEADFNVDDISSTDIRNRIEENMPIYGLVPYSVEKIIYENALYASPDVKYITSDLKKRLSERRFCHSVSTMREALILADRYGADRKRCCIAGLAHDCEKVSGVDSIEQAQKYGVQLDEYEKKAPWLIHAKLGAFMVKMRYGVRDGIISEAIASHTLGAPHMTDVAMITYLADCTEKLRDYPGVDAIRSATSKSLRDGMLEAINRNVEALTAAGKPIHPQTLWTREWLLNEFEINK